MFLVISMCSLASRPIVIQLVRFILEKEIVMLIYPTVILGGINVNTFWACSHDISWEPAIECLSEQHVNQ